MGVEEAGRKIDKQEQERGKEAQEREGNLEGRGGRMERGGRRQKEQVGECVRAEGAEIEGRKKSEEAEVSRGKGRKTCAVWQLP